MIKKCLIILFVFLMVFQTVAAMPSRQGSEDVLYLLGLNYPWLNYGQDFGATGWGHSGISSAAIATQVEADFARMKSLGVGVVRWFLLFDGRAAPKFDDAGLVTGFDQEFYADFDKALEIAAKYGIYLVPVLWDFHLADAPQNVNGVQLGGRAEVITDSDVQQSFLDNALKPLLERYGQNPTIIAWDVINEPEGAMQVEGGNWVGEAVPANDMQAFVTVMVEYIHSYTSHDATVGSASRGFLSLWTDSYLDFYQYHYYDHMEDSLPFDYPAADLGLDKPVVVGEFPTKNTNRTLAQYLDTIWQNGYAGAWPWSYRAGDNASDFESSASEYAAWAKAHSDSMVAMLGEAPVPEPTQVLAALSKFDFESGIMGWYPQDWVDSMACLEVRQSNVVAKDGQYSLECVMDLKGQDPNLSKGEALVDLQFQASRGLYLPEGITANSVPLNLDGHTITIWVYTPKGSRGYRDMPNGFQVFVKDVQFRGEYGIWFNIVPENEYVQGMKNIVIEDQWWPVTLTVSPPATAPRGVWVQNGFDPTQVIVIGLKMGTGGASASHFEGSIYLDAVDWD